MTQLHPFLRTYNLQCNAVVLSVGVGGWGWEDFSICLSSNDIWQSLETFLVIITDGEGVLLVSDRG